MFMKLDGRGFDSPRLHMTQTNVLQEIIDREIDWREKAISRLEAELEQNLFRVSEGKETIATLKDQVKELKTSL